MGCLGKGALSEWVNECLAARNDFYMALMRKHRRLGISIERRDCFVGLSIQLGHLDFKLSPD